jgi:hypothetical protein
MGQGVPDKHEMEERPNLANYPKDHSYPAKYF